jgi:hypothetical protein
MIDVILIHLEFKILADVVDKNTDDIPMTQVFDIFFENISLQAFESKAYLLIEHSVLEMFVRTVRFSQPLLGEFLKHMLCLENDAPRADHGNR